MEAASAVRGWYDDPFGKHRYRFWDGERWTGYAADNEVVWDDVEPSNASVAEKETPTALPGFMIAIAGYFIGIALAFAIETALKAADEPGGRIVTVIGSQLGLWTGLVGACLLVSKRRGTGSFVRDFGWRFRKVDVGFGLAGAFAGRIVSALVAIPIPTPFRHPTAPERGVFDRVTHRPIDWVVLVIIVCIGAPVIEELFFRGLMQPRLVQRLGTGGGVVVTALLFGAAHLTNWQGAATFAYVAAIAGGGLVLCMLRQVTGRLGTSTWAHFFFNAQAVALVALLR